MANNLYEGGIMKKVLVIFLLLFALLNVKAYTFSEWQEVFPKNVKEEIIQSEERFLWQKEEMTDIEYLPKEKIGDKQFDLNDSKYSEWSSDTMIKPEKLSEREIKSERKVYNPSYSEINHLLFTGFMDEIYFSEIEIFNKENSEKIEYDIEDVYFDKCKPIGLNNGDYKDYVKLNEDCKISLNLKKEYDINNLEIIVHYNSIGVTFWRMFYTKGIFLEVVMKEKMAINGSGTSTYLYDSSDKSYYDRRPCGGLFYTYRDKLYKTYNVVNNVTDEYYSNLEGYEKIENSKKIFYRYITNKVILYDVEGNVVFDEKLCQKSICIAKIMEEPKEEKPEQPPNEDIVENPKTLDNIEECVLVSIISLALIGAILIVFKKNVIKCHANKRSNFVTFNTSNIK